MIPEQGVLVSLGGSSEPEFPALQIANRHASPIQRRASTTGKVTYDRHDESADEREFDAV
jgi:hypothetical protein